MVATVACSRATCDSSAIVTLSRKRRCTRVLSVRRNQVAAAVTPRPIAVPSTIPGLCSRTPLPSSISHNARRASGSAASCDSTNAAIINRGSWRYPNLHSRHIDDIAGGSGSIACSTTRLRSGEDVICRAHLLGNIEALRLQFEHGSVAAAERHQVIVRTEFDHSAVLKHADTIGMADGGKTMGNQDGRAMPCRSKQAGEDLRFTPHVELRGRLVEQHHACAELDGCQRAG